MLPAVRVEVPDPSNKNALATNVSLRLLKLQFRHREGGDRPRGVPDVNVVVGVAANVAIADSHCPGHSHYAPRGLPEAEAIVGRAVAIRGDITTGERELPSPNESIPHPRPQTPAAETPFDKSRGRPTA